MHRTLSTQFGTIVGCKFFKTASVPYAFIKLGTVEEAQKALAGLNGTTIMGRSVLVKAADADAQYDAPNENLYVRNAPLHWNEESIRQHFSTYGTVLSVKLLPMQNHSKALAAMVRMATVEEAEEAKNACNAVVPPGGEMALNVKYADTPEEKVGDGAARSACAGAHILSVAHLTAHVHAFRAPEHHCMRQGTPGCSLVQRKRAPQCWVCLGTLCR
jgi:hypothetical protein